MPLGVDTERHGNVYEEFKLPWREDGPPNHHDDKVDSDQYRWALTRSATATSTRRCDVVSPVSSFSSPSVLTAIFSHR